MENFIPFIIGIAFYIYKTWSNFREEQEKAKKRNPGAPAQTTRPKAQQSQRPVVQRVPEPVILGDYRESNSPYEPLYRENYQQEKVREERAYEERHSVSESRNPERVMKDYSGGKKKEKQKPLNVRMEEESPVFDFDMRDAIIKEAILNRPKL